VIGSQEVLVGRGVGVPRPHGSRALSPTLSPIGDVRHCIFYLTRSHQIGYSAFGRADPGNLPLPNIYFFVDSGT
jgi:hypothetical protein